MAIRTDIPFIDQLQIQADVLVPVLRAFQAELGEEHANAIASRALADVSREQAAQFGAMMEGTPIEKVASALPIFSGGGSLDVEEVEHTDDTFAFKVTGCRYAEYFKQLGVPELGYLISCSRDQASAEGLSPDLRFERTQTIMQGADHCDFRYSLKSGD